MESKMAYSEIVEAVEAYAKQKGYVVRAVDVFKSRVYAFLSERSYGENGLVTVYACNVGFTSDGQGGYDFTAPEWDGEELGTYYSEVPYKSSVKSFDPDYGEYTETFASDEIKRWADEQLKGEEAVEAKYNRLCLNAYRAEAGIEEIFPES